MLKVAPVSTKYLSLVSSSVRKISPALAGKCLAIAVACDGVAAGLGRVLQQLSFLTKHRAKHTCEPCWRSNCEIYTIGKNRNQGGRWGGFWNGCCHSFCCPTSCYEELCSYLLSHGSRACSVVAASSNPQGIRGLHHGYGCLVVASSYRFSHGRRQANEEHG
jgi:hypothetical protein